MKKTIEIPLDLYQRLGKHAQGFETPASVIEKILEYYEKEKGCETTSSFETVQEIPMSLEIVYHPSDEEDFKEELLKKKIAYLVLHNVDGTREFKEWNAEKFQPHSSVNGNLRSGYLRGWKNKGIFKAEISTNKNDLTR